MPDGRAGSMGSNTRSYRPDIDGLRAFAVLSVVLYHAGFPPLRGGFSGVDIFFAISGYLIGGHIFTEMQANKFSYARFYARRARRILPAYYAVVICTLMIGLLIFFSSELWELAGAAFAATLSYSNILFWNTTNYFNPTNEHNPLLMTWSLGVEEQFYLVIPLLIQGLTRFRRSWILPAGFVGCLASFLSAVILMRTDQAFVFYMLPTRAWELGVGVLFAIFEAEKSFSLKSKRAIDLLSIAGLALIVAPVFLLTPRTPFPGAAALPSVLGTMLLLACPTSVINRRLLATDPFVFIGRISYSFYLLHWPILAFIRILCGDKTVPLLNAAAVLLAFALSVLSFYFIEQPFRKSRSKPFPLLLRYALLGLAILAATHFVQRERGLPQRFPDIAKFDVDPSNNRCAFDDLDGKISLQTGCDVNPSSKQGQTIAIWGDSHAQALAPAFSKIAKNSGLGFRVFVFPACLPLIGASIYHLQEPTKLDQCRQFNRSALKILQGNQNIKIVVLAGFWDFPLHSYTASLGQNRWWIVPDGGPIYPIPDKNQSAFYLQEYLSQSISALTASGKKVVVIGDAPNFSFSPRDAVRNRYVPVRFTLLKWLGLTDASIKDRAVSDQSAMAATAFQAVSKAAAEFPQTTEYDLRQQFCDAKGMCLYRTGGRSLYIDNQHLSLIGADYALQNLTLPLYQ